MTEKTFNGRVITKVTTSARIIRADGTIEDLGMISSSKWSDRVKIAIKEFFRRIKIW